MAFNYGDVVRALLGNNPNPYARLDIGNGLRNLGRNIQNRWDNWAMYNLPQAPGMQAAMFQQLDETDPNTWAIYNRAGF